MSRYDYSDSRETDSREQSRELSQPHSLAREREERERKERERRARLPEIVIRPLPELGEIRDRMHDRDQDKEQASKQQEVAKLDRQPRESYSQGDRDYRLNDYQIAVLQDVGMLRTVSTADLTRQHYFGDKETFYRDISHLAKQELITVKNVNGREPASYLNLTNHGKQLVLDRFLSHPEQEIHAGAVKPRELKHDAAVFRVFQAEKQHIERGGGRVKRVVLDFELKRKVYRELARRIGRSKLRDEELRRERERIARQLKLRVVCETIQIPDVRTEYEDSGGGSGSSDAEYVSGHYKSRQIAMKAAAGFTMYGDSRACGRHAEYSQEIISSILDL